VRVTEKDRMGSNGDNITAEAKDSKQSEMIGNGSIGPITWDDATWILTSSFIIFTMQSGKRSVIYTNIELSKSYAIHVFCKLNAIYQTYLNMSRNFYSELENVCPLNSESVINTQPFQPYILRIQNGMIQAYIFDSLGTYHTGLYRGEKV